MRFRTLAFMMFVGICLIGAPGLYAQSCADCYGPDTPDPSGISTPYAHCYWSSSGIYGSCVSGTGTEQRCSSTSTASYCPNSTGGGGGEGGGGGGGGQGGGGGDCRLQPWCPPECPSCGGFLY